MENPLTLILFMLALLSGAVGIFFAHRTMQKYKPAFTASYFYFVVFLYIFGAYSLAGSGLLESLLYRMEADPGSIHMARIFSILAGMPLLALGYYMWMRTAAFLLDTKLPPALGVSYLVMAFACISAFGYLALRLIWFEKGAYELLIQIQWWVFAGMQSLVFMLSALLVFLRSGKLVEHLRIFARRFAAFYMLYGIMGTAAFLTSQLHMLLPFLFLFLFLAWHLIPILYMNSYLTRFHGETARVEKDFEISLDEFVIRHDISKREREVVVLISKGLSNQQISDALFISLQTVKDHVHRIFVKTGVKNRIQLSNLVRASGSEA